MASKKPPRPQKTDFDFSVFSREADRDYLLARLIHFLGATFQPRAGFFAQQACEKYLKALSVQRDGTYLEIHKLLELAKVCEPYGPFFSDKETIRILEQFDIFDQLGRYGGAANYDPISRGKPVFGISVSSSPDMQVKGTRFWNGQCLQDLDNVAFHMRALLDFDKISYADELKMVLEKNPRCSLIATWKFPAPLWQLLTVQNNYFKLAHTS